MEAVVITVGDEILVGQVIDSNSAWLADRLREIGIRIQRIVSVADKEDDIIEALNDAHGRASIVLMTGGLGPTKDDITKKAIAAYYNVALTFDQATFDRIQRLFERWGRSMTDLHRNQCYMPENAELLFNRMGTAPGMWFDSGAHILLSMPGVPYEMKAIMEDGGLAALQQRFQSEDLFVQKTICTVGEGEARMSVQIEDIVNDFPPEMSIAYLPSLGYVRIRLTARGSDVIRLEALLGSYTDRIAKRLGEFVYGYDNVSLEEAVQGLLVDRGLSMVTAESCTGGHLGHRITSIAGSSVYYKGGVVVYSNALKEALLGVSAKTLQAHGAVSEATVLEMHRGALQYLHGDLAVAITGIAGPDGGTAKKPVGTIWVAWGNGQLVQTKRLQLGKNRTLNIRMTSTFALNMIRKFVLANKLP